MLAFKFLLNRLNLGSVEKVMAILLGLCRFNQN